MDFEDTITNSDYEDDLNTLDRMSNDIESSIINRDEDEDIARAIEMSLLEHNSSLESGSAFASLKPTYPRFVSDNININNVPTSIPIPTSTPIPTSPRLHRNNQNNQNNRNRNNQNNQNNQNNRNNSNNSSLIDNNGIVQYRNVLNNVIEASMEQFNQQIKNFKFRTRPMEMLPNKYHINMYNKINQSSDKIIIPERIITNLYGSSNAIINDGVLVVEIRTYGSDEVKYATVSQYIDEDICYLPNLMFYGMLIDLDTICHFRIVDNITKTKRVVLKPEIYEFMHIKDQMKLMFDELNTNFRLLREDQQIIIHSEEVNKELTFIVDELYDENNNRIQLGTIYDVDLEVEFKINSKFNQRYIDELAEKKRIKEAEERERRLKENPPITRMIFSRPSKPNINTHGNNDNTNLQQDEKLSPKVNINNESFSGEGYTLGGKTDRLLSREELRKKRLQNLKFLGPGKILGQK
jgi:hypothetical protein